jgi:hypothetical protein
VVTLLPLRNSSGIPALVSYDGAIAIPQCGDFPSRTDGVRKLNEILCSLLLGGVHVEVLRSEELVIGALHDKTQLFAYTTSIHTTLRVNWAALTDRLGPLMRPRVLMVEEIHKAYRQGQEVVQSMASFSPLFLLSGYTAMVYRNNSDALNNLWITVEQLTEHLWNEYYLKNRSSFPDYVAKAHLKPKIKKTLGRIATKHKLLCLSDVFSKDCYRALSRARRKRNALAHEGAVPDSDSISQLWSVLPELLETAAGISEPLGLRRLSGGVVENWDSPARTDFDEWVILARAL